MKEVIKTIVLVILAAVTIYYGVKFRKVNDRMNVLNEKDSLQSVQVRQFDHKVNDLELRFEGRGKHIQNFQDSLVAFNQKLDQTYQKFNSKVDSLDFVFQSFESKTNSALQNLKKTDKKLNTRLYEFKNTAQDERLEQRQILKRLSRKVSSAEEDIESVQKTLENLQGDNKE